MSWASRRRGMYVGGVIVFFGLVIGIPVAHHFLSIKPTCFDGRQDGGETAVDEGGPCVKLDPRYLTPISTLWARSFEVRPGDYTAIAYIENPNPSAGVASANYEFGLYDSNDVLIADATGTTYIMPGGETPVVDVGIQTGNRVVVHTYFQLTDPVLDWEHMENPASAVSITNEQVADTDTAPQVTAQAENTSYADLRDVGFSAVLFDTDGNAIEGSTTELPDVPPQSPEMITFTWPQPLGAQVGQIDIIPLLPPQVTTPGTQ